MLSHSKQTQQLDNLLEQTTQELRWLDTEIQRFSRELPEVATLAATLGTALQFIARARWVARELDAALSSGATAIEPLQSRQTP